MAWLYLLGAGLCEIGWPIGLKYSADPKYRWIAIASAIIALAVSGVLLWLAQRDIPIGTAYAVWTGIGAAGAFLVGIWLFGDAASPMRTLGVTLIIAGVVTLKLAH